MLISLFGEDYGANVPVFSPTGILYPLIQSEGHIHGEQLVKLFDSCGAEAGDSLLFFSARQGNVTASITRDDSTALTSHAVLRGNLFSPNGTDAGVVKKKNTPASVNRQTKHRRDSLAPSTALLLPKSLASAPKTNDISEEADAYDGTAIDFGAAEAAAALAAVADEEQSPSTYTPESDGDPEWGEKPKNRGRPKKRRAVTTNARLRGSDAGGGVCCAHCGTSETPRWWKDNFPIGVLCNACGIWLKRHGYPRPVQFFVQQNSTGPPQEGAGGGFSSSPAEQQTSASEDQYYLINGRPKRRRHLPVPRGYAAQKKGEAEPLAVDGSSSLDAPLNYNAAGKKCFVIRRKMDTTGDSRNAALVQFGWAPFSRQANEMYDKVVSYGEGSDEVTVDDFELLGDFKATATLVAKAGVVVTNWDVLVRHFVDTL